MTAVGKAFAVAEDMATEATFATAAAEGDLDADHKAVGLAHGTDGAKKALDAAAVLRDATASATPGSGYAIASGREQVTTAGEEWKTTWAITAGSMDAWTGANGTSGPVHTWWGAAKTLTIAVDAWHTYWNGNKDELTPSSMTAGSNVGNTSCDLTAAPTGGTWGPHAASDADKATCATACETASADALLYNPNTDGTGGTTSADNGGKTMAKLTTHGDAWCGGYSYDTAASTGQKCQLLLGASGVTQHGT